MVLVPWVIVAFVEVRWGGRWNLDLHVYRDAAHALLAGGRPFATRFTVHRLYFTYPPFALLAMTPLAILPWPAVATAWWWLNSAALVYMLCSLLRGSRPRGQAIGLAIGLGGIGTLALEPLRSNIDYGQINVLLMAMVVVDVTRPRSRWRGALVGLAGAAKLTPLLFLAYYAVRGDWRSCRRGILTFTAASVAAGAVLPSASTSYWLHQLCQTGRIGNIAFVSNQSWEGVLHRAPFGARWPVAALALLLDAGTFLIGMPLVARLTRMGRSTDALLALAIVGLLVSPISWTHHWVWVVLAPMVLLERGRLDRAAWAPALVCLVALSAPYWWSLAGAGGALANDSLALAGAAFLVDWWVLTTKAPLHFEGGDGARASGLPAPGGERRGRLRPSRQMIHVDADRASRFVLTSVGGRGRGDRRGRWWHVSHPRAPRR